MSLLPDRPDRRPQVRDSPPARFHSREEHGFMAVTVSREGDVDRMTGTDIERGSVRVIGLHDATYRRRRHRSSGETSSRAPGSTATASAKPVAVGPCRCPGSLGSHEHAEAGTPEAGLPEAVSCSRMATKSMKNGSVDGSREVASRSAHGSCIVIRLCMMKRALVGIEGDVRWTYGASPVGNAEDACLQQILPHLAPNGTAGIILVDGSLSARSTPATSSSLASRAMWKRRCGASRLAGGREAAVRRERRRALGAHGQLARGIAPWRAGRC